MLKDIKIAIQHRQWQRVVREFSDELLENALSNFRNWREYNPNKDYSLSPDDLDKRIAFIESLTESRI